MSSTHPSSFADTIPTLCQALGIKSPTHELKDRILTISVDDIEIDLAGLQEGYMNFMCFPGVLTHPTVDALTVILSSNCYQEEYPAISFSMVPGEKGKILMWSRASLERKDIQAMVDLMHRMADTALSIRRWIKAGAPAMDGSKAFIKTAPKKSTLAKLDAFSQVRDTKKDIKLK